MSRRDCYQLVRVAIRFLGGLELVIGFLSLGLATFLLRIETKRVGRSDDASQALALLSMMTAGALAMIIARSKTDTFLPSPRR